jgi:hypothetical protein
MTTTSVHATVKESKREGITVVAESGLDRLMGSLHEILTRHRSQQFFSKSLYLSKKFLIVMSRL